MKPFDLEAAKAGESVVTRDGEKVRVLGYVPEILDFPVIAYIEGRSGISAFTNEGRFYEKGVDGKDLFMVTKKRTVWVNLYEDSEAYWRTSKNEADRYAKSDRIGGRSYPIEIEE